MTTRRAFAQQIVTGTAAVAVLAATPACFLGGTVFTQIATYVGIGLTAFQAVVMLVNPGAAVGVTALIAIVKAGFVDLQLAVQAYNNAPAADKATLLGRISTVLASLQSNIQQFWVDLHLPDGTLATLISGLLGIILSTLAGFAGALPQPASGTFKLSPVGAIPVPPQRRTKAQFIHDFNAVLIANGQPAVKFS